MGKNVTKKRPVRKESADALKKLKKKPCMFCANQTAWIDYKDTDLLRRFISDRAKIRARRVTGNCMQHQADIAGAIKVARELALLPYLSRPLSDRNRGRAASETVNVSDLQQEQDQAQVEK